MAEFLKIETYRATCERELARLARLSGWNASRTTFSRNQITQHIKDLRKLARLGSAGRRKAAMQKQARILRSFPARLCGTLSQLTHAQGSEKHLAPISWEDFEFLVQESPLAGNPPDPCTVFPMRKANGKMRIIASPGPMTRAAQIPLLATLEALGVTNSYDFNSKGKGAKAALLEIKRLILEEGIHFFIVFDFAECFSSVRPKHLSGFKLPNEVLMNVVFYNRDATLIRSVNNITMLTFGGKCDPARRGIPQGATASGKLTSALLGRELRHLNGGQGIVTYVDDGVIGARTRHEANEVAQALKRRFANLSGGPIHFKHIDVWDVREGLEFLGYWIRLVEADGEPEVRFTPSHQAKMRFRRKLHQRLRKRGPGLSWEEALDELTQYRRNWILQKTLWEPSDFEMMEFEIETEIWVDDFFNGYTKKIPIPGNKLGDK